MAALRYLAENKTPRREKRERKKNLVEISFLSDDGVVGGVWVESICLIQKEIYRPVLDLEIERGQRRKRKKN